MTTKQMHTLLICLGLGVLTFFYLGTEMGGDLLLFTRLLFLNKIHFHHSFDFPHFTPGHCGGFFLGGDPQNPIFTVFQAFGFWFQNQYIALKFGGLTAACLFFFGYRHWLTQLGVRLPAAKTIAAFFVVFSGWWVAHWKAGHITFHSVAFLPWLFAEVEKLIERPRHRLVKRFFVFTLLTFLLLNAGQIWFQFAFLYLFSRVIVAVVQRTKWATFGVVGGLGIFAILFASAISAIKLSATIVFVLQNFTRDVPITQVVSSNRYLFLMLSRAFFDARIMFQQLSEPHLGSWWEWTAYLGIASIPAMLLGVWNLHQRYRNAFQLIPSTLLALTLAAIFQWIFCRYDHVIEWYRAIIPPARTMTFYYRGVILMVLLYGSLFAHGMDFLLSRTEARFRVLAMSLLLLLFVEFTFVYSRAGLLRLEDGRSTFASASYAIPDRITAWQSEALGQQTEFNPLTALSLGQPSLSCYNPPLFGYGGQAYQTQVKPGLVIPERDKSDASQATYNMNDIKALFPERPVLGYFQHHAWPKWQRSTTAVDSQLDGFLKFQQVIPVPFWVELGRWISWLSLAGAVLLTCLIFLGILVI